MPDRQLRKPDGLLRRVSPAAVVIAFALVITAGVLGVMAWKALDAKKTTLARGQTDTVNLAHSLAEHATHAIQSADIAMAGMVELLKYRDPIPERFNRYLAETVSSRGNRQRRDASRGKPGGLGTSLGKATVFKCAAPRRARTQSGTRTRRERRPQETRWRGGSPTRARDGVPSSFQCLR